ncbi:hypothetical protein P8452_01740 [Trifolium repens]|nr:hypothetical protein P8452_01740 [Trifolium repens]
MMPSHTTLEQKFVELENADETTQIYSQPKIQRVPVHLRNRKQFKEHYLPRLVSIGPIHHNNANLKLGEKYKLIWAKKYIETFEIPHNLYKKIADNINILKDLYDEDVLTLTGTRKSLKGFGSLDEKLSWILFVDGCSLLHILVWNADFRDKEYWNIKVDQLVLVMRDVLLLENQLPYLVLKLLWKNQNETELIDTMKNFLNRYQQWTIPEKETNDIRTWSWRSLIQETVFSVLNQNERRTSESPTHLLDLHYRIILPKSSSKIDGNGTNIMNEGQKSSEENTQITYRNIKDLRAAGIKVKSSETRRPIDIAFVEGWFTAKLILPEIVVDDYTSSNLFNLLAYEMCPDFENDYGISSFAMFMDSLIDHPNDVRELRSKGILLNSLGNDQEVADLFNIITTDVVFDEETYKNVKAKINKHCYNKYKNWIALGINTYLNNPWTFIAVLAAFIALTLTFLQTWFTINPAK